MLGRAPRSSTDHRSATPASHAGIHPPGQRGPPDRSGLQAYAAVPEPKVRPTTPTAPSRRALWGALVAWSLGLLTGIMLSQVW